MDLIQKELLEEIADLHGVPAGAYNIRANGAAAARNTTANIDIVSKEDKPGIDIIIKPGTKKESVHIPVVISQTGLTDLVYNDFHIGDDSTYQVIDNGHWLSDEPYGTIHRIAGDGTIHGVLEIAVNYCKKQISHLRIDTHHDNKIMQHVIEKNGFKKCGIIYVKDGSERIAYELI